MSEPAGIVIPFAGSVAPDGWLLCDGSAVSRTDYADLFTAIGTVYGAGDGVSTFNLPDLSGRVVLGVSQSHALGTTGGEATHTLTESELPAHSHVVPAHTHANDITATTPALSHSITQPVFKYNSPNYYGTGANQNIWAFSSTSSAAATRTANAVVAKHDPADCTQTGGINASDASVSSSTGTDGAHNNLQPYLAVTYIISTGEL
jgi:microcystin-dependent protein